MARNRRGGVHRGRGRGLGSFSPPVVGVDRHRECGSVRCQPLLGALEERAKRIKAESSRREVVPPGHSSAFFAAPMDYQVNALHQAVAKFRETGATQFGQMTGLDVMLRKLQRTGTDAVYEPLGMGMCIEGLDAMVGSGELERTDRGFYKIP